HQANAAHLAASLDGHAKVQRLFYPGLPNHPGHALAQRQMSGFGGIITLEVGDLAAGKRFCEALGLFTLAESLGGVETLLSHPAGPTTHCTSRLPAQRFAAQPVASRSTVCTRVLFARTGGPRRPRSLLRRQVSGRLQSCRRDRAPAGSRSKEVNAEDAEAYRA